MAEDKKYLHVWQWISPVGSEVQCTTCGRIVNFNYRNRVAPCKPDASNRNSTC